MNCCILEAPSKKLIYFIGYIIFSYIKELIERLLDKRFDHKKAQYFDFSIFYTIGDLICGLFVYIIKKRTDSAKIDEMPKIQKTLRTSLGATDLPEKHFLIFNDEESEIKYNSIKRVLYLSIYDLFAQSCIIIYFFVTDSTTKEPHNNTNLTFIIYITSSFILDRFKIGKEFYSHYYLSISINLLSFCILATSDIYFMFNFNSNQWFYLIQGIISAILYTFENTEGKIGLNIEFLNPYILLFYKGIIQSIFLIIISIILIISNQSFLFTDLFEKKDYNIFITFIIIFFYLMSNLFTNLCLWKIIDFYSIQHIAIAKGACLSVFYIEALIKNNLNYQNNGKTLYILYFTDIFGFILLFIGILIHNEIIIVNCCGLSDYTHKKLLEREKTDLQLITSTSLNSSYNIENKKTKDSKRTIETPGPKSFLNSLSELSGNLVEED